MTIELDSPVVEEEGVELEETTGPDSILDPFDPTGIRVETKPITIDLLVNRIKHGEINLNPAFQRKGGLWSEKAQSRLIESLLIRIPLPAFYMDATDENEWLVVDGLQRLTSLRRFVLEKSLRLTGMEFLRDQDTKDFDQLPRHLQRRILETQVTAYLIEKGTPPEVKFNIFKRINTGGLPLSAQEIRHALNQGKSTKLLQELAGAGEFKEATSNAIRDTRMADREFVLRFLAFATTPYAKYSSRDFDAFLNKKMEELNKMSDENLAQLQRRFLRAMRLCSELLGRTAFRKQSDSGRLMPINKALFETWSVNLERLSDDQIGELQRRKDTLVTKTAELLKDDEFLNAISQGTGDVGKVSLRFSRVEKLIEGVLQCSIN